MIILEEVSILLQYFALAIKSEIRNFGVLGVFGGWFFVRLVGWFGFFGFFLCTTLSYPSIWKNRISSEKRDGDEANEGGGRRAEHRTLTPFLITNNGEKTT